MLKGSAFLDFSWTVTLCSNRVASLWHPSSRTFVISRGKVPNADFLSSDWFIRLWEGQPFSFAKF